MSCEAWIPHCAWPDLHVEFFPSRDVFAMDGYAQLEDDEEDSNRRPDRSLEEEEANDIDFADPQGDEGYSTADEASDFDFAGPSGLASNSQQLTPLTSDNTEAVLLDTGV